MHETTQFCIGLQDEPGLLADLCGTLRAGNVNIEALFVADDPDCCWVNLVVDDPVLADRILRDDGYNFFTERVLSVGLTDRPGELERVARRLADARVNINYTYGSSPTRSAFNLILNVSDVDQAKRVLDAGEPSSLDCAQAGP